MLFTPEHEELRRSLQKFIAAEVNPHVDEWEEAGIFPAHPLFKKMGDLGFLGLTKPVEYGGQGLDYSYAVVMAEELGNIACGSVADAGRICRSTWELGPSGTCSADGSTGRDERHSLSEPTMQDKM